MGDIGLFPLELSELFYHFVYRETQNKILNFSMFMIFYEYELSYLRNFKHL